MEKRLSPSELYQAAVEQMPPEHISHWCSDLYLKVTPVSEQLVKNYAFREFVHMFRDQIDGVPWYEIPFLLAFFGLAWVLTTAIESLT